MKTLPKSKLCGEKTQFFMSPVRKNGYYFPCNPSEHRVNLNVFYKSVYTSQKNTVGINYEFQLFDVLYGQHDLLN